MDCNTTHHQTSTAEPDGVSRSAAEPAGHAVCLEPASGQQPPDGNTGGKLTTSVSPDWLNVTFPSTSMTAVKDRISLTLGAPVVQDRGKHFYRESMRFEDGAILAWSDDLPHCSLSLNGDSCSRFNPESFRQVLKWAIEDQDGKVTRIDLAFDDYTRELVKLDDVHAAANAGDFAGYLTVAAQRPMKRTAAGMVITGDSVTFGKRGKLGSGKQVCIYDKNLESAGRTNAVRIEARFFKDRAAIVGEVLASSLTLESFQRKVCETIGGAIDFVNRIGAHGHLDRMARLPFWQRIVDVLGQAPITVLKLVPPLQRTMEYFKHVLAKSFATSLQVIEVMGMDGKRVMHDLLDVILDDGRRRIERDEYRPGARDLGLNVADLLQRRSRAFTW